MNERTGQHAAEAPRGEGAESPRDVQADLDAMEDRWKRALADLDNYRKRSARELERLTTERTDAVIGDWLEVVDSVERALLLAEPDSPLALGLLAVREQIDAVLERQGVNRIGREGEPFDPGRHEAIGVVRTDDVPANTVAEVARSGYAIGNRVLRPAQVIVARPKERED
ncbi:MAG TPA: nucleotide exchange factor GrpE [Thermoleophilaceae bacterium]|nr:nucleotide exchange factor GrpE [Thermoleophilaceae bacterium]